MGSRTHGHERDGLLLSDLTFREGAGHGASQLAHCGNAGERSRSVSAISAERDESRLLRYRDRAGSPCNLRSAPASRVASSDGRAGRSVRAEPPQIRDAIRTRRQRHGLSAQRPACSQRRTRRSSRCRRDRLVDRPAVTATFPLLPGDAEFSMGDRPDGRSCRRRSALSRGALKASGARDDAPPRRGVERRWAS
jgi:hypothetical protein